MAAEEKGASIEVDGRRVSLTPEGIARVLREKDGAKKFNAAVAAAVDEHLKRPRVTKFS